jgi:superfamily II DNA/RNA helicase
MQNLPPKFLIFFDSIVESIEASKYLRSLLPPELRHLIKWFNADMSQTFRDDEFTAFKDGKRAGLCCTDSFGMVSNTEIIRKYTDQSCLGGRPEGYSLCYPMARNMQYVHIMAETRKSCS